MTARDRRPRALPSPPRAAAPVALAALAALAAGLLLGCGKKAPPLPPLAGSKPRVTDLEVRQVGSTVRARFTLPIRAGSETVDYVTRGVELWRRAAPSEKEREAERPRTPPGPRPPAGAPGEEPQDPGLPVGPFTKSAVLAVSLTGQDVFDLLASPNPELVDRFPADVVGTELEYALVLKTDIKPHGTVSDLVTFTPRAAPAPPADVAARTVEGAVELRWTPATDEEGKPLPVAVYRGEPGLPLGGTPVTPAPVATSPWKDPDVGEGETWRYVLHSVQKAEGGALESDPAPEVTATYRDVFPPAVPDGLRAFVDASRVTLLWTPNDDRDLLGYVAWRRARGGEWTRLNEKPLSSATTSDVPPGPGRWEYAVSSVDRATPGNESERSRPVAAEIEAP